MTIQLKTKDYSNWIRKESGLPWLMLPIEVPWKKILNEIENLDSDDWILYRPYSSNGGWSTAVLHGLEKRPYNWEYYAKTEGWTNKNDAPNTFTQTSKKCKFLMQYIEEKLKIKKQERTRIMNLAPGGKINLHHDRLDQNAPLTRDIMKLNTLHLSITNPKDSIFCIPHWGNVPASNGSVFLFNNKWEHTLENKSNQNRYHIIFNGIDL